jgi:glycosyltransferase involved in cell wall biosynthesis
MNLVFVVSRFPGGGVLSATLPLCEAAHAAGHDATLLFVRLAKGATAPQYPWRVDVLGDNADVTSAPTEFANWIEANRPDAVVLSGTFAVDPAIPHLPPKCRVLVAVHDASRRACNAAVHYEGNADALVAVSNYVADEVRPRLKYSKPVAVIGNAIVVPQIAWSVDRPNDLYFVGGSSPLKGPSDLLELWPRLLKRGYQGRLHIVGEVDDAFRERLAKLPEPSRVIPHGRVTPHDVERIASQCRTLLMLSRSESFSMAMVEAAMVGCPAVAWRVPSGHLEVAEQLGLDYLAPFGDYDRLADETLRSLADQPAMATDLARRAADAFNAPATWAKYEELLSRVAGSSAASRPRVGQPPPSYRPRSLYQWLPEPVRRTITRAVFRSRALSMWLRNYRGS